MSKTIIESRSKVLLEGFEMAIKLFHEEAIVTHFPGCILIEDDDPIDNMTYTIDREFGLRVKHSGVVL